MARQISPRPYLAMKLIASGVTNSAASVRSPSFSRSSSSTTTIMRPDLNSARAPGTSVNGGLDCMTGILRQLDARGKKRRPKGRRFSIQNCLHLQGGFDLKTPSLEKRFRDILRILVPPGPLAQPRRTHILIGS